MSIALVKSAFESGELVFRDKATGTEVAAVTTTGMRITALTPGFGLTQLRLGVAEEATIASGVLTVTETLVRVTSESGTTDTVDSIVKADVAEGDILVLIPKATDTITYDDANIDLAAATRATAPGGVLVLMYSAATTQWQEVVFLAASDNV